VTGMRSKPLPFNWPGHRTWCSKTTHRFHCRAASF